MSQDAPLRLVGLPPSSGPLNRCVRLRVCVWWLTAAVCSVTAAGSSDCHGSRSVRMRGDSLPVSSPALPIAPVFIAGVKANGS